MGGAYVDFNYFDLDYLGGVLDCKGMLESS